MASQEAGSLLGSLIKVNSLSWSGFNAMPFVEEDSVGMTRWVTSNWDR